MRMLCQQIPVANGGSGSGTNSVVPAGPGVIEKVTDCCRRHGIAPGIQNRDLKMAKFWRDHGMLFLGCSNETSMLYDRAREITSALR